MQFFLMCVLLFCAITNASAQTQTSKNSSTTLMFIGDVVLDGNAGKEIANGKDPFAAFSEIFLHADFRIANLECVVASEGAAAPKMFTFRAHPRTLSVLRSHIDAVANANNHSGDFGQKAFVEMLDLLDQQGIKRFGGGRNLSEAHRPLILEKNGLKIALLSYNEFMPRSFEANVDAPGIAWSEDEQVVADIKQARQAYHADIVIPFMHWGWENELKAGTRQRLLAHKMIEAGADAVIGGHPHVRQDTEQYMGKPILYSIGNFMIDALDNDEQTHGWIVRLHIDKGGVQAWDTQMVNISDDGIPTPDAEARTPCWNRQKGITGECRNGELN